MQIEIATAANIICGFASNQLDEHTLSFLHRRLSEYLEEKYGMHWYLDDPDQGSAYRSLVCCRDNVRSGSSFMDPVIHDVFVSCGLNPADFVGCFPDTMTVWVDPGSVSYKIGQNGSVCEVYSAPTSPVPGSGSSTPNREPSPKHMPIYY
eukprot:Clim_evm66s236 gene=Clim_evmTU66s236